MLSQLHHVEVICCMALPPLMQLFTNVKKSYVFVFLVTCLKVVLCLLSLFMLSLCFVHLVLYLLVPLTKNLWLT